MKNIRKCIIAVVLFCTTVAVAAELPQHPNRDEIKKLDESSCEDGFSFAVIGDSHVSITVFESILDIIADKKPDFAVSVGDFTDNGLVEEYEQFVKQIARPGVPWFAVPGNHEYRSPEGHTSLKGQKRYKKIFGKPDFLFDHCGWRFIGLDVPAYDRLLPVQMKKLEKAVRGREGRVAVFMHYPPAVIPKWEEGIYTAGADQFMKTLEENSVRYFFSGHVHVHDSIRIGPTTYIVTGGGGGGMDKHLTPDMLNSPDGGPFHHFILVNVEGDQSAYEIVRPEVAPEAPEEQPE